MQVSVEKLDTPLEHKVNISIPPDWIDSEVDKQVQEHAVNARLPGFRPGKIPFKVMVQRYGPGLSSEIIQGKIATWIMDAFEVRELKVAGFTSLDFNLHRRGSVYEFSVTVEVRPEIPDSAYENLTVVVSESEIKEKHVQKTLRKIAVEHAEYAEMPVSSGQGERITLQYRPAELADDVLSSKVFYFSGLHSNLKEFDKTLEGVRSGDRIEIEFDPDSLFTGSVPREEAKRSLLVLIHKVEKFKEEPQVNDALAEKLGVEEGGLEELKKQVAAELERDLKEAMEELNRTSVQDALHERNERTGEIIIPRCLYFNEGEMFGHFPVLNEGSMPDPDVIENRKKNALFALVHQHVYVQHYGTETDREQLKEFVSQDAQRYNDPDEFLEYALNNEHAYQRVQMAFRQKKAMEKIMETANSTTRHIDADESLTWS